MPKVIPFTIENLSKIVCCCEKSYVPFTSDSEVSPYICQKCNKLIKSLKSRVIADIKLEEKRKSKVDLFIRGVKCQK